MQKPDTEKLQKSLKELDKILKPIYKIIKDYQALNYRTPEEETELEKLLSLVKHAIPAYAAAAHVFGNEAYIAAVAYYNLLKRQAEKGDQQIIEIIKELAPLYEKALLSQIDLN